MGKQIINMIECGNCHKEFDVSTEDIEWEHLTDAGETEENRTIHDYCVFQTVTCPHCKSKNKIVLHAKGNSESSFKSLEVVSLEIVR